MKKQPVAPAESRRRSTTARSRLGPAAVALAVVGVTVWALGGLAASTEEPGPHVQIVGPETSPGPTLAPAVAALFQAPSIGWPLLDLDPSLAGPRPTLAQLSGYFDSQTIFVDGRAAADDWRLASFDPALIWGYSTQASVPPGQTLTLCLGGSADRAQIRVFRMGLDDAIEIAVSPTLTVNPITTRSNSARSYWSDPLSGRYEASCRTTYPLAVGVEWRSGFYLAKVTAANGAGSYVPFVVRSATPVPLLVIVPLLTDQAYNSSGGASLYRRPWNPLGRATEVSLDRPLEASGGAGTFFITGFPLIVWLEDHGYQPGYATDLDLAIHPELAAEARVVLIAGHAEYWTESMREALLGAEAKGVGVAAFGANLAYWQIRLAPNHLGVPDRTIVCFKTSGLDPVARTEPQLTTILFGDLPRPEPAAQLFGANYVGLLRPNEAGPLFVAPGLAAFTADTGLEAGQRLADLAGDELDGPPVDPSSALAILGARLLLGTGLGAPRIQKGAASSISIMPSGARVFDAGTFTWGWGLDPRYAAALPGFPADAFARLTAEILAWVGAPPGPS